MNKKSIPIDRIDTSGRIRAADPVYVREIAASMKEHGQMTPVEVRAVEGDAGAYKLVFGLHRIEAAQLLGWTTIEAELFKGTVWEARLREIDENLVRRDLSVMDRAAFVAEREKVWNEQNPELVGRKKGAMARWHDASDILSFASDAAVKLGVSTRSVERWLDLNRRLSALPDTLRARLAASDFADKPKELLALIELAQSAGPAMAAQVVDMLMTAPAEGESRPRNVRAAADQLSGGGADEDGRTKDERDFDGFAGRWPKYSDATQRRILEFCQRELRASRRVKGA